MPILEFPGYFTGLGKRGFGPKKDRKKKRKEGKERGREGGEKIRKGERKGTVP